MLLWSGRRSSSSTQESPLRDFGSQPAAVDSCPCSPLYGMQIVSFNEFFITMWFSVAAAWTNRGWCHDDR